MREIAIAVVDHQPVFVAGVRAVLARVEDYRIVGAGRTSADAFRLVEKASPDILLLDIDAPGDGLHVVQMLAGRQPKTRVVVCTGCEHPARAVAALNAGAYSYVLKTGAEEDLLAAVDCALRDEVFISPGFAARLFAAMRPQDEALRAERLNCREEQIVALLLRGKSNREIAGELKLSEKTVKSYMTGLMQKLHARSRLEVVLVVNRWREGDGAQPRMPRPPGRALHPGL